MPQTKHKRKTKHRGNAAGVVESRGRTGRRPTAAEKNPQLRQANRAKDAKKGQRLDRPPTWKGAFFRALAAAFVMAALSLVLIKRTAETISIFPVILLLYIPISYYTDRWSYRRRQRSKTKRAATS